MVNHLVATATRRSDRVALARRLDRAGATLSRQTSPESAEVTVWGPAEDGESLLALLAEVVLEPRFDAEDIARLRRQMLERQLRERTQPASRAEYELLRAIFPTGHPYRETGIGDRRSVARLDRNRLAEFHRRHYTSRDAAVIVTGPATLSQVERAVRHRFSPLPEGARLRLALPAVPARPPRRVMIHLPGRSQVEVRVGGTSISRSSPEYPGAFLANEALGGRPMLSRLFQRIRERNGLAYHASSQLEALRFSGFWTARAGTGADRWRRVVPMLEAEVARVRASGLPAAELRSVRESAIGEIPLSLESTADAHHLAVDVVYHGLPAEFWAEWPARLRELTPGDVRRASALAFDRTRSATVVVGPIRA